MKPRIQPLGRPAGTDNSAVIVVFPHAGGSPRAYSPWSGRLPAGIDLYGVTYPGRDALLDEPAPETFSDLVSGCATELEPLVRSSKSVLLFGHSMGAYAALEVTRALQRSGLPVAALAVSGVNPPHLERRPGTRRDWHRASDDDLIGHIGEMDKRSLEVLAVPELRDMFLPIIRDDYRLVENYRCAPEPQLSCPLHVMYGESDPDVTASDSTEWAGYTRKSVQVRPFPGDHFYVFAHPAQVVAHLAGISRATS